MACVDEGFRALRADARQRHELGKGGSVEVDAVGDALWSRRGAICIDSEKNVDAVEELHLGVNVAAGGVEWPARSQNGVSQSHCGAEFVLAGPRDGPVHSDPDGALFWREMLRWLRHAPGIGGEDGQSGDQQQEQGGGGPPDGLP